MHKKKLIRGSRPTLLNVRMNVRASSYCAVAGTICKARLLLPRELTAGARLMRCATGCFPAGVKTRRFNWRQQFFVCTDQLLHCCQYYVGSSNLKRYMLPTRGLLLLRLRLSTLEFRDGVLEDYPRPRGRLEDKKSWPWPWPWPLPQSL